MGAPPISLMGDQLLAALAAATVGPTAGTGSAGGIESADVVGSDGGAGSAGAVGSVGVVGSDGGAGSAGAVGSVGVVGSDGGAAGQAEPGGRRRAARLTVAGLGNPRRWRLVRATSTAIPASVRRFNARARARRLRSARPWLLAGAVVALLGVLAWIVFGTRCSVWRESRCAVPASSAPPRSAPPPTYRSARRWRPWTPAPVAARVEAHPRGRARRRRPGLAVHPDHHRPAAYRRSRWYRSRPGTCCSTRPAWRTGR